MSNSHSFFSHHTHNTTLYSQVQKRIQETEITLLTPPRSGKPLLVLDIDYTIYDCSSTVEVCSICGVVSVMV
jgi:hypothetical protein